MWTPALAGPSKVSGIGTGLFFINPYGPYDDAYGVRGGQPFARQIGR